MFIAFVVSPIPYARNLVLLRRGAGRANDGSGTPPPGNEPAAAETSPKLARGRIGV